MINRLLQVFHDAPGAMSPDAEALAEVPELTTETSDPTVEFLQATRDGNQLLVDSTIAYTYDDVGNRKDRTDTSGLHLYTYDALDQLTVANYPDGFAVADTTFTYDAVGNRTRVNSTPYSPNSLNQYTQVGPTPLTWSPNGNLTSDGLNTYTYDSENRLLSSSASNSQYTYDPFGRRLSKTTTTGTTRFLYDGDQLIADTTSTGSITQLYLYGPGIDEPLLMTRGSQRYFYLADGLGSITALTSLAGQTVESYTYDVYGKPLQPSTLGNRFRFTGREYDSETQLYYYRARYYHPTIGRFCSRDPLTWGPNDPRVFAVRNLRNQLSWLVPLIRSTQRRHSRSPLEQRVTYAVLTFANRAPFLPNRYLYVGNNPVNWIDPFGLDKEGSWWEELDDWWMNDAYASEQGDLDALMEGAGKGWLIAFSGVAAAEAFHVGDILIGAGTSVIGAGPGGLFAGAVLIGGGLIVMGAGAYLVYAAIRSDY